jgi:hypothetical protein
MINNIIKNLDPEFSAVTSLLVRHCPTRLWGIPRDIKRFLRIMGGNGLNFMIFSFTLKIFYVGQE